MLVNYAEILSSLKSRVKKKKFKASKVFLADISVINFFPSQNGQKMVPLGVKVSRCQPNKPIQRKQQTGFMFPAEFLFYLNGSINTEIRNEFM